MIDVVLMGKVGGFEVGYEELAELDDVMCRVPDWVWSGMWNLALLRNWIVCILVGRLCMFQVMKLSCLAVKSFPHKEQLAL